MPGGPSGNEKVTTTLRRNQNELGVWREADHPNLVPLLATIDKGGLKSMVTPFYNNGDLTKYLRPNDGLVLRHHLVGAIFSDIVMWYKLTEP